MIRGSVELDCVLPTRAVRESLAESRESANLLEDAQNIADTTMFNNLGSPALLMRPGREDLAA